eukprot:924-Heterococcus_DN1.PRE.1
MLDLDLAGTAADGSTGAAAGAAEGSKDFSASVWDVLQIVDAFMTSPVSLAAGCARCVVYAAPITALTYNLEVLSQLVWLSLTSVITHHIAAIQLCCSDVALKWTLRFTQLGGVEHLASALQQVTQQVEVSGHKALASQKAVAATAAAATAATTSSINATCGSSASSSSSSGSGAALLEARTLCIAELCRILHRLFQLDQSYAHACAFDCRWERLFPARLLQVDCLVSLFISMHVCSAQYRACIRVYYDCSCTATFNKHTQPLTVVAVLAQTRVNQLIVHIKHFICSICAKTQVARLHHTKQWQSKQSGSSSATATSSASSHTQSAAVAAEQQINDMKNLQGGIIKNAMAVLQALVRQAAPPAPLQSAVCHGLALVHDHITIYTYRKACSLLHVRVPIWAAVPQCVNKAQTYHLHYAER